MKHLKIPFQIGMQYENWEFDLDILPDRIKGYDSYLYIGKEFNYFLNFPTDKTELLFNMDILEAVIITFKNTDLEFYNNLKKDISKFLYCRTDYKLSLKSDNIELIYGFKLLLI